MGTHVAIFSDTYRPTINGVTYTIDCWARRWNRNYGRMDIVYPGHPDYQPAPHEWPLRSLPFPFYDSYRVGLPWIPTPVREVDVVHVHSLAAVGVAGWALSTLANKPLVASYHTPLNEYGRYLVGNTALKKPLRRALRTQERIALERVDAVVVPSEATKRYLQTEIGVTTNIHVISNGIDLERFTPQADSAFPWAKGEGMPVLGYTGRHGHEKNLHRIIEAAERMDPKPLVVLGGDGPAREHLEAIAADSPVDVEFLGFLSRERLPEFYSAIDVFAFPSTIETEGLVAMEAIACGTPVVGADYAGLQDTVRDGQTGRLYPPGDVEAFADALTEVLQQKHRFENQCQKHRTVFDVEHSLDQLTTLYSNLQARR